MLRGAGSAAPRGQREARPSEPQRLQHLAASSPRLPNSEAWWTWTNRGQKCFLKGERALQEGRDGKAGGPGSSRGARPSNSHFLRQSAEARKTFLWEAFLPPAPKVPLKAPGESERQGGRCPFRVEPHGRKRQKTTNRACHPPGAIPRRPPPQKTNNPRADSIPLAVLKIPLKPFPKLSPRPPERQGTAKGQQGGAGPGCPGKGATEPHAPEPRGAPGTTGEAGSPRQPRPPKGAVAECHLWSPRYALNTATLRARSRHASPPYRGGHGFKRR